MDDKEIILEEIFEKCRKYFKTNEDGIEKIKEFGNGKSGNSVYLIEVKTAKDSVKVGKYVLKVSYNESDEFLSEIMNTKELSMNSENKSQMHFPSYEYSGEIEKAFFYIYDMAGSDLTDTLILSGNMRNGESVFGKISRELLLEWNQDFSNRKISIIDLIKESVGKERLVPQGRIYERIEKLIDDALVPSFKYEGITYPNPYYYLNKEQGPLAREINAVIGRVHGDLNCNNLIVNKNIMDKSFDIYLIDYSHYKNDEFLLDDHAYLQLDLLLTTDAIANIYEWNKRVLDDFEIGNDRRKYNYQFMRYIRDGIVTFIKSKQPKGSFHY